MAQALEYLFGIDFFEMKDNGLPRYALDYMGWNPEDNVNRWLDLTERIPCYHWDDAGYWLFSLNWNDPLLIGVQEYMNVVGTDMNCLLLSTPDPTWILSKIATNPGMMRIKIIKRYGSRRSLSPPPSVRFGRRAIGYRPYRLPDLKKTGVNKILVDDFSCKFPDHFYSWYKPTRDKYAKAAKLAIKEALRKRLEKRERQQKGPGRPKKNKKASE